MITAPHQHLQRPHRDTSAGQRRAVAVPQVVEPTLRAGPRPGAPARGAGLVGAGWGLRLCGCTDRVRHGSFAVSDGGQAVERNARESPVVE